MRRYVLFLFGASLFLALLGLTACGDDDDATNGGATKTEVATTSTSGSTTGQATTATKTAGPTASQAGGDTATQAGGDTATQAGGDTASDVCSLVKEQEVEAAIGEHVTASEQVVTSDLSACQYTTEQSKTSGPPFEGLNVRVVVAHDAGSADSLFELVRIGEEVPGLGDEARWSGNALNVLVGSTVLGLEFFGEFDIDKRTAAVDLGGFALDRLR